MAKRLSLQGSHFVTLSSLPVFHVVIWDVAFFFLLFLLVFIIKVVIVFVVLFLTTFLLHFISSPMIISDNTDLSMKHLHILLQLASKPTSLNLKIQLSSSLHTLPLRILLSLKPELPCEKSLY